MYTTWTAGRTKAVVGEAFSARRHTGASINTPWRGRHQETQIEGVKKKKSTAQSGSLFVISRKDDCSGNYSNSRNYIAVYSTLVISFFLSIYRFSRLLVIHFSSFFPFLAHTFFLLFFSSTILSSYLSSFSLGLRGEGVGLKGRDT